jgi:hypothetical protein
MSSAPSAESLWTDRELLGGGFDREVLSSVIVGRGRDMVGGHWGALSLVTGSTVERVSPVSIERRSGE